jgi:hypothetical protein
MALVDYSFVEHGDVLRLECRVQDGWRKGPNTYCYSQEIRVPWLFNYTLKVHPAIFSKPTSLAASASNYLLASVQGGGHSGVEFRLDDHNAQFNVRLWRGDALNPDMAWSETEKNGRLCISWSHVVSVATGGSQEQQSVTRREGGLRLTAKLVERQYRLDLLIVFEPPSSGPPPIVRDWFRRFYPGGLPSLGKRR